MRRLLPVLVGEAPSRDTDGLPPFSGRSGKRLAALLGRPAADAFLLENVLARWPGPAPFGKGSAFPMRRARAFLREAARCAG